MNRSSLHLGAPPIPKAQLVYSNEKTRWGVAVQGMRYVCDLPRCYAGPGLELAVLEGGTIIAVHPDHPPLVIDPSHGTTRPL